MTDPGRIEMLLRLRRDADAVEEALRAIAANPTDPYLYALLARAHLGAEEPEAAERATRQALGLQPDSAYLHDLHAFVLLRLRRRRAALRAAESASSLAPDDVDVLFTLTRALLANFRFRRAREVAHRCTVLAPHSLVALHAVINVALARQRWKEAEAACRRVLAIDPEDVAARHNLGVAISKQAFRRDEGIDHLAAASRLDPRSSESRTAIKRITQGGVAIAIAVALANAVRYSVSAETEQGALDVVAVVVLFVGALWVGFPAARAVVRFVRRIPPPPKLPNDRALAQRLGIVAVVLAAAGWLAYRASSDQLGPGAGSPREHCHERVEEVSGAPFDMLFDRPSPNSYYASGTAGGQNWVCIANRVEDGWQVSAIPA